jgi:7-keto-8-aminopelargonate synthetase-like enzyme
VVPYVCGSETRALEAAQALATRGFLVTAIRPPTVPPGTSRLRVALSADHSLEQVDALALALAQMFPAGS